MTGVWKCPKCRHENGPLRDVFCGKCGARRRETPSVRLGK